MDNWFRNVLLGLSEWGIIIEKRRKKEKKTLSNALPPSPKARLPTVKRKSLPRTPVRIVGYNHMWQLVRDPAIPPLGCVITDDCHNLVPSHGKVSDLNCAAVNLQNFTLCTHTVWVGGSGVEHWGICGAPMLRSSAMWKLTKMFLFGRMENKKNICCFCSSDFSRMRMVRLTPTVCDWTVGLESLQKRLWSCYRLGLLSLIFS